MMGRVIMGKNYFTEEQQEDLRANPYVEKISKKSITYTTSFKEKFYIEYLTGKGPTQILLEMGFNSKVLGKKRKDSIVRRMKAYELRADGFNDQRTCNSGRPLTKTLTDAEKVKRLEQKIAYLSQENEFLKKNIQIDRQATWDYKRRHPKDSNSSKK